VFTFAMLFDVIRSAAWFVARPLVAVFKMALSDMNDS
jgi:hypothetical protein